jgi:hypothetical protein
MFKSRGMMEDENLDKTNGSEFVATVNAFAIVRRENENEWMIIAAIIKFPSLPGHLEAYPTYGCNFWG